MTQSKYQLEQIKKCASGKVEVHKWLASSATSRNYIIDSSILTKQNYASACSSTYILLKYSVVIWFTNQTITLNAVGLSLLNFNKKRSAYLATASMTILSEMR